MNELKQDLIALRALLEVPDHWTKLASAREPDGSESFWSNSETAVRWCLLGACEKVAPTQDRNWNLRRALRGALHGSRPDLSVCQFNDDLLTKHEDILALIDKASESADVGLP